MVTVSKLLTSDIGIDLFGGRTNNTHQFALVCHSNVRIFESFSGRVEIFTLIALRPFG